MAYYSSSYFQDDDDDDLVHHYDLNPYGGSYDSNYYSNTHQLFDYNPVPNYYGNSYSPHSYSSMAYSASTFSQPRLLQYNQNTQFVISYSTVDEFNVTAFEEYDPTPYGGGYDLAQTYGKPLPPSDEICYPRSTPADPNAIGSLTLPGGKEEIDHGEAAKPGNGSEDEGSPFIQKKEDEGSEENRDADDNYSWSGYGNGKAEDQQYPPSGYGLEAMDLCESLFGYWPCLSREKRRCSNGQECADNEGSSSTADYLFGSPYPYGERRDVGGSYGDPNYGYQMPLYRQVDYE